MWQWIIAIILLIVAVFYIYKSIKKSIGTEHDCPSCDAFESEKKMKKF